MYTVQSEDVKHRLSVDAIEGFRKVYEDHRCRSISDLAFFQYPSNGQNLRKAKGGSPFTETILVPPKKLLQMRGDAVEKELVVDLRRSW